MKTNWQRLIKMHASASNWATWCYAKGRYTSAIKYYNLMNKIESYMRSVPAENLEVGV